MIRWYGAVAAILIICTALALVEWLRSHSAPHAGFDRAGDPNNGHPARKRQPEGAAATADIVLGKGGNGAPHSTGGRA